MASSISFGYTLNPETRIISLSRSTMRKYPSGSMTATSPVWNQPLRIASAVSSGRFQYPSITCGPRMQSSPRSPGSSDRSGSSRSTILQSVSGIGMPIDPGSRRVQRVGVRDRRALGQPVALDEPGAAGDLGEPFRDRGRQRRRARDARLHRTQVELRGERRFVQRVEQTRHARHEGRLLLRHLLEHEMQVPRVRDRDHLGRDQHRDVHRQHPERVEERERAEERLLALHAGRGTRRPASRSPPCCGARASRPWRSRSCRPCR